MDKTTAQRFIQNALDHAWARLHTMYGSKVGKQPSIELNTRLRVTAGRAWLDKNKIDISYKLLCDFPEHFRDDTIPHEAIHFVAYRVFGEQNHGKPWKYVMAQYGLPTTPYHDLMSQLVIRNAARAEGIEIPKYVAMRD